MARRTRKLINTEGIVIMSHPITQKEIELFNQNFVIKQTYRMEHEEKISKLPNDFYKNNYLNDLEFEIDRFEPEYIDDSGRTFIQSKNNWKEYLIDDISDIVDFIKDEMPQILKDEALYEENEPRQITFTNSEKTNTKGYSPVTQI